MISQAHLDDTLTMAQSAAPLVTAVAKVKKKPTNSIIETAMVSHSHQGILRLLTPSFMGLAL